MNERKTNLQLLMWTIGQKAMETIERQLINRICQDLETKDIVGRIRKTLMETKMTQHNRATFFQLNGRHPKRPDDKWYRLSVQN